MGSRNLILQRRLPAPLFFEYLPDRSARCQQLPVVVSGSHDRDSNGQAVLALKAGNVDDRNMKSLFQNQILVSL